jgi:Calcineurin-like phosphoesterase
MALADQQLMQPCGGELLLPPVQSFDAAKSASIRGPTCTHTGRARGCDSRRTGTAPSTYLRTVTREIPNSFATCRRQQPSTNTLWRMTCTWSTLSILSGEPAEPAVPQTRDQGLQVDQFPSGAPMLRWVAITPVRPSTCGAHDSLPRPAQPRLLISSADLTIWGTYVGLFSAVAERCSPLLSSTFLVATSQGAAVGLRFDINLANWISFVIDEHADVPPFAEPQAFDSDLQTSEALGAFLHNLKRGLFSTAQGEAEFGSRIDRVLAHMGAGRPVGQAEFALLRQYFNPRDWTGLLLPGGGEKHHSFDRWICSPELLRSVVDANWATRGLLLQLDEPPRSVFALTDVFPAFSAALEQRTVWPALLAWTTANDVGVFPLSTDKAAAIQSLQWLVGRLGKTTARDLVADYHRHWVHRRPGRTPAVIIHISDIHLGSPEAGVRLPRLESLLTELVERYRRRGCEVVVLLTGDLMDTPGLDNLDRVRAFLRFLRTLQSRAPVVLIGNHDVREDGFMSEELRAALQLPLGGGPSGVFVFEDCGVCVVAVNSVVQGYVGRFATGFVGERQMIDLANELDRLKTRSEYTIVAAIHHHPTPVEQPDWYLERWYEKVLGRWFERTERLVDAADFLEFLKSQGVGLVLHGHKHIPRVDTVPGSSVPIVGCGSSVGKVPTVDGSPFLSINVITLDRANKKIAAQLLASRAAGGRLAVHAEHEAVMVHDT